MKLNRTKPDSDDNSAGGTSRERGAQEQRRARDDPGERDRRYHDDLSYAGPERRLRKR